MPTLIHRYVELARAGKNPAVIARLASGWLVMGEHQALPGYCVLLPDPVVATLNELQGTERARFLADMAETGDALLRITDAVRINYDILGNVEPALHAHVTPRYAWEDDAHRRAPQWSYDRATAPPFDPALHGEMQRRIADALRDAGPCSG